jgi:integrase
LLALQEWVKKMPTLKPTRTGTWETHVSFGRDPITGKRIRRHLSAATKELLEGKVAAVLANPPKPRGGGDKKLKIWLREYAKYLEGTTTPRHAYNQKSEIERWLIPEFGKIALDKITGERIESGLETMTFLDEKTGIRISPTQGTRVLCFKLLRASLNLAVKKGRISRNPASDALIAIPKEKEVNPLALTEQVAFLKACEGEYDEARWVAGIAVGPRASEALGLQWGDRARKEKAIVLTEQLSCPIKGQKSEARVPLKTKASKRTLTLPDFLDNMLDVLWEKQGRPGPDAWMFAPPGRESPSRDIDRYRFKKLLKKAGIERPVRIHDLRHTTATNLLRARVSDKTVQAIMGWSSILMVGRYQHPTEEITASAIARTWDTVLPPKDKETS